MASVAVGRSGSRSGSRLLSPTTSKGTTLAITPDDVGRRRKPVKLTVIDGGKK